MFKSAVSPIIGWLSSVFFYFTPIPPFFDGVISHFLFYIPAAKASCGTANLHCPLIELLGVKMKKIDKIMYNIKSIPMSIRGMETAIHGCHCPGIWRCASLRYWPGRGWVYVCPLLFVCVMEMCYFRVTLLKAVSKRG